MRQKDFLARVIIFASLIWLSLIAYAHLTTTVKDSDPDVMSAKVLPKIACPMVGSRRKCFVESLPPQPNSTVIWSEFIGIGPARSGSSNLLWSLQLHPQIQVGFPSLHQQECCPGAELQFFWNDNLFVKGIEYYRGYFNPRKPLTKIAGEKTPGYSDHPLVPYRIRAMLGPKVKLLFTLRDPIEALLSLYHLRKMHRFVTINEYFQKLINDQKVYDSCVQAQLESLLSPTASSNESYFDLLNMVDYHTAMIFDEAIMKCWNMKTSLKWHNERLQHYFYKENLIRWHKVIPNQVLCIWSDEYRAKGLESLNRVLEFLGVDKEPPDFTVPAHSAPHEQKLEMKRQLGSNVTEMCDIFIERNRGIEEVCPRMWTGTWEWCTDS